jgi:hypothetical protein
MATNHAHHVANMMDDESRLGPNLHNKKSTRYTGHCAVCDYDGRSVRFRQRAQGRTVPADFIIPPRVCDAYAVHNRVCGVCHSTRARTGELPIPTTQPRRAITRDHADEHSVSAAAALVALSTRVPMDLDLEAVPPVDDRGRCATPTPTLFLTEPTQTHVLPPTPKRSRMEERHRMASKSGGTQDEVFRGLAEARTRTVAGVNILTVASRRGSDTEFVHQPRARVSNNKTCKRSLRYRANSVSAHRIALSFVSNVDEDVNNQSELKLIESEMMQTPTKFQQAIDSTNLLTPPPLSAHETAQIISISGVSGNAFKTISKLVGQKRKLNIFASSQAVKKTVSKIIHESESDFAGTQKNYKIPFIRFKNIAKVLDDHVIPVIEKNSNKHGRILPKRTIKMVLTGDKGGNATKLGISVINRDKPQSRYNILPMAMYEGDEDYDLVKEVMSQTIRDIEQWAKSVTARYTNWNVKLLLGGDTYWLWDIMGLAHKGKYYCPFCECTINKTHQPHTTKHINKRNSPSRKYKDHITNLKNFNDKNLKLKNSRGIQAKSADCKNCIREPLISEELYENIVPPILHIDLGIVKIIVEEFEALSNEKDLDLINNLNYEDKDGEVKKLRGARLDFETSSNKIAILTKAETDAKRKCETAVAGTKTACEKALRIIKKQLKEQQKLNSESSKIITEYKGEYIKAVTKLYESIQPKRKHNVGLRGTIVGSVATKMFTTDFIAALSSVLSKDANEALKERAANIIQFMNNYSKAREHIKSVRELSKDALKELSTACTWMGDNFHIKFPRRTISPKLHMLFIHVPQFARKHNNLGLFSESAFESIHAEFNQYDRTYASVTDRLKSLQCIWQAAELRRQPGFDEYKPIRRLCATCGCAMAKGVVPQCECPRKTRTKSGKRQRTDDEPVSDDILVLPSQLGDESSMV